MGEELKEREGDRPTERPSRERKGKRGKEREREWGQRVVTSCLPILVNLVLTEFWLLFSPPKFWYKKLGRERKKEKWRKIERNRERERREK